MEPKQELRQMRSDVISALDKLQHYPSMVRLQKILKDAQEGK